MGILNIIKKKTGNSSHKSAELRKQQTEKLLKKLNVPFIDHLPLIEEEDEVKIRTAQEIAERILILTYLNYILEVPEEKEKVINFLESNNLWNKVSNEEKVLFKKSDLTEQESINISWRSEAIWILLWALNKVDNLELPIDQANINEIVSKLPNFLSDPTDFIENAEVRPTSEILDISDLTYRLHWAARNAYFNNQPMPANLNLSIIIERHYAINWVTYYADDWDEITTDT